MTEDHCFHNTYRS